jgi:hypothetical protein
MSGELLYGISEILLFVLAVALFFASAEIGFRFGRRTTAAISSEAHSHVATIEAALLGLLALLLGFAFAMAMSRYDMRRQLVLEEANDIQTTALRVGLLADKFRAPNYKLLVEYVDSRIEYFKAGADRGLSEKALSRTGRLQEELWKIAVAAVREDADMVRSGLYIQSLNGVIDDHTKRVTAMNNHVPEAILGLLFFVGAFTLAVTGYSSGLKNARLTVLRFILIIVAAATLMVIVDLDRPRRGFIKVGETSLLQVQESLARTLADIR